MAQNDPQEGQRQSATRQYKIDRVAETLFLGVIIDECLTWNSYIQNLTRKISKSLGIIYRSSFCRNKNSFYYIS